MAPELTERRGEDELPKNEHQDEEVAPAKRSWHRGPCGANIGEYAGETLNDLRDFSDLARSCLIRLSLELQ